jgi:hypothetical protein
MSEMDWATLVLAVLTLALNGLLLLLWWVYKVSRSGELSTEGESCRLQSEERIETLGIIPCAPRSRGIHPSTERDED